MLASKEAKKSGVFLLPGFGKLVLANRKARIGRNPQTGEPLKIPAKRVCKFRRSEEHTSELQSQSNLVCRLLLEKKKKNNDHTNTSTLQRPLRIDHEIPPHRFNDP